MVALNISSPSASLTHTAALAARTEASHEAARYDAILVARFNTGDELAFKEIMTRYRGRMLSVALRRLGNHADAEEIVQDTFIRAHRGLATFRGEASLSAWLHRIALNLSHNRYWYFFRRRRHATLSFDAAVSDSNDSTLASVIASDEATAVTEVCRAEFAGMIAACMARLSKAQREILVLRGVQQHSYFDIARMLGIGVGTAKSRISRARLTLRTLLDRAYPELRNQTLSLACFEPTRGAATLAVA
jgi:RNA polymerase sigma-70 factor (ECF subfamily)